MDNFDKIIKEKAQSEEIEVPQSVSDKIEEALLSLPEETEKKAISFVTLKKACAIAASLVFICLFILPNVSPIYAQALEKVPVLNSIIKVVTIRNYFYSDENHEMNIVVPELDTQMSDAADYINKSVSELSEILVNRFNDDLREIGDNGHSSIYLDYEVVTNNEKWFTLKITVFEAAGSSNTYYEYYHIDKESNSIVKLEDIVADKKFYETVENEIRRQMKKEMSEDSSKIYWSEKSNFGMSFSNLTGDHNFYWDKNGNLVIVYDKYEIAPGYMGTPEFTVDKKLIEDFLKPAYQ